jgi:hypothetical protein
MPDRSFESCGFCSQYASPSKVKKTLRAKKRKGNKICRSALFCLQARTASHQAVGHSPPNWVLSLAVNQKGGS